MPVIFYLLFVLAISGCVESADSENNSATTTEDVTTQTPVAEDPVTEDPVTEEPVESIYAYSLSAPALTEGDWYRPVKNVSWQWQLLGELNTSYQAEIYDIDLFDTPQATIAELQNMGKKVICYFSAGSFENWRPDKDDFSAADYQNTLDGWEDEKWLNIKSESVHQVMLGRLDLAKEKGCDGVEPDNMDGYTQNTGFDLTADDQLAYNRFIANQAHLRGLSVGLKNDLEQIDALVDYFDFAVNEQCFEYEECEALTPFANQNKPILNAEYLASYVENPAARRAICAQAKNLNISLLVLPLNLDDSDRKTCFNSEEVVYAWNFEQDSDLADWSFSSDYVTTTLKETDPFEGEGYLNVTERQASYFGTGVKLKNLAADTLYVAKMRIRRLGEEGAGVQHNLNLKVGGESPQYIELAPYKLDSLDWHLVQGFIYLTQEQLANPIHLYINTASPHTSDYDIDAVEIVKINQDAFFTQPSVNGLSIMDNQLMSSNRDAYRIKSINLTAYLDHDEELTLQDYWQRTYTQFSKEDFANIRRMGFNSVRLTLDYRWFEDEQGHYLSSGFQWLDLVLAWAEEHSIKVILDMHAPQGGGFQGPGSNNPFWHQPEYQRRFIKLWQEFATRYKSNTSIAAFDLINEPSPPQEADYIALLDQLIPLILEIDPTRLILVENSFADDAQLIVREENNIIHDLHFYDPWDGFTDDDQTQWDTGNLHEDNIRGNLAEAIATYQNKVFHIGEFGQRKSVFEAKNALAWVEQVIKVLDENDFHYSYFSYKGNVFGIYGSEQRLSGQSSKNEPLIEWFSTVQQD